MRLKRFIIGLIGVALAGAVAAEAQGRAATASCDLDTLLEELETQHVRKKERNNLLFMREEEKLARDVYLSLYEEWGLRIFRQIARSERSHMKSALVLIDKYELEDPVGDNPLGVFTNKDLQQLYEELSSTGQSSLVSALRVGAAIEELDIHDLQRAYRKTNNEDLRVLYQNLMKGSRNHLRAFADVLRKRGESYEPALFTAEEYRAILDSSKERGILDADGEPLCG